MIDFEQLINKRYKNKVQYFIQEIWWNISIPEIWWNIISLRLAVADLYLFCGRVQYFSSSSRIILYSMALLCAYWAYFPLYLICSSQKKVNTRKYIISNIFMAWAFHFRCKKKQYSKIMDKIAKTKNYPIDRQYNDRRPILWSAHFKRSASDQRSV